MKRNKNYSLLSVALLLFISSCMVGPKFQQVEMQTPESYRFQNTEPTEADTINWQILFNDPVLANLIDSALTNNLDRLMAVSSINEARAYLGMAKADMYPQFSYSASFAYGNTQAPSLSAMSSLTATTNLNWEIDFWGKYRRATEAAKADLLASEYGLQALELSLVSQVAITYHTLLDYKNRLEISRQTLESRKESHRIIRERFEKGIVPEIDLNQAQIQEATAAAAIPVYERSIAFTENALSVLIGQNPAPIITETALEDLQLPNIVPAGLPSELLERRPDILQAEQMLKAQNARIGVAQAMRFPSISLTGLLGIASADLADFNSDDAFIGSAGADLFGPIFQFGKNKRRVEAQREVTEQMKYNYEKAVLSAFRETEDALIYISTLSEELKYTKQQLEASKNAAKLSRQRYDGGVTSYLEVLDAERALFNIELYYSELLQKSLEANINLYKSLGGGW